MTDFLQLSYQGLVLGAIYALIALGFVIIYKASDVINFAHGEFVLLGAYLVFFWRDQIQVPYALAVLLAIVMMAFLGWAVERSILRRMIGKPIFAVVMITIGLAIVIHQVVTTIWGHHDRHVSDPWGARAFEVGGINITAVSVATLVLTGLLLALFFVFFKFSKAGVAMRASAFDPEAALSLGISVRAMTALAWAIAGATATVAGIALSGFPSSLSPTISFVALRAFPAAILGGLDSPGGAVIGGLAIGWIELMVRAYQPSWLGENFHVVAAYAVMVLVLMVRPYGLFGTKEVERV